MVLKLSQQFGVPKATGNAPTATETAEPVEDVPEMKFLFKGFALFFYL